MSTVIQSWLLVLALAGPLAAECAPFYSNLDSRDAIVQSGGTLHGTLTFPPSVNGNAAHFNGFAYNQQPPCPHGSRSIGVARMRRDAFVGLTPARADGASVTGEAYVLTRPVKVMAKRLLLNIEHRSQGASARVSLHEPDGSEVPGFGVGDSVPITADAVRHVVTWRNRSDASEILGRRVSVRITLTGKVIVYALQWG